MTAVQGPTHAPASERPESRRDDISRGPPKAIQLLVPVWGTSFISQFLEVSLPTLLAPGNLPALANALPCKLVFLTSSDDAADLNDQAAIHYLRGLCEVEIRIIDDLITGDNYSTTITLAYARAVRAAGDAMLDTCFFFMISDYIIADGSLANVLARMRDGSSGVVAGNFQVTEESAKSSFFKTFDLGELHLSLRPRDLIRWALDYLHPMTLANMVNFPLCHSTHCNRLFWRVDENTLVGRFYLMHMICIRPEAADFVVGSSCDYSFIPEMCPSGKVHVVTDSDEYLVVEMQKHGHERNFVRLGSAKQSALVGGLAEWATATHRRNAHSAVVFHAAALPPDLEKVVAESATYVEAIEQSLPPPPPHRNHPYWLGAMAAHEWAIAQRKKATRRFEPVTDLLESSSTGFNRWLYRFRNFLYGRPPQVRPWHPRWPDYGMFLNLARRQFAEVDGPVLILSNAPMAYSNFLSGLAPSALSFNLNHFMIMDNDQYRSLANCDGCLLILGESQIGQAHALIQRIQPLISPKGTLLIFAVNGQGANVGPWFSVTVMHEIAKFYDRQMWIDEATFVPAGFLPWVTLQQMQKAFALVQKNWLWITVESFVVFALTVVSFLCNLGRRSSAELMDYQSCSSLGLVLHKTAHSTGDLNVTATPHDISVGRYAMSRTKAGMTATNLREDSAAQR